MTRFEVDRKIVADCHSLGKWGKFWVLLQKDAGVRWLIIVPETDATEWHDLDSDIRDGMVRMGIVLGVLLKEKLSCDKVNIATIGNVVPQFHLHVIGRWKTDPYWPGVVWGRSSIGAEYTGSEIEDLRGRVAEALGGEAFQD